ncbi:MAG: hypothetical protein ABR884_04460 [Minisyncoccia bacterium]|jgi:hypothetical protein
MEEIFDFNAAKEALCDCVREMYPLSKGERIVHPDKVIFRSKDIRTTRKQIKHVIEQRKAEGKSADEIRRIISYIPKTIIDFDFEIVNSNQKYAGSMLRVKVFKKWGCGMVAAIDKEVDGRKDLITAYPYRYISAYFLLLKKLHTSAAGKTPHP